ncbi:MAG: methylcobamide:CoM methyltransferase MtbA [Pseudomonadota bacterium]
MLTPKKRLEMSLRGEPVDRLPCVCPGGMMTMIVSEVMDITENYWPEAHSDPALMSGLAAGMYKNGGFENFGVPFCMTVEAEAMGARVSLGTRVNEPRVTAYPITSVAQWRDLTPIDVESGRRIVVTDAIRLLKAMDPDVPVVANLTGPVSLAASLMEPVVYYKELLKRPGAAHEMMDFVTRNLIAFGRAQLQAGADVLTISDPSGTGELLGPRMFREYALPCLNRIIDSLGHLAGVGTIIHICGRLKGIYRELNLLKSDAISFDSITDVKQVAENVTGKVLMGNVSTIALETGTPRKIRMMSMACMDHGVRILAPACGVGPRTSLENIRAMVDAAKGYGAK